MIEYNELKELLISYNLNYDKIIKDNDAIFEFGDYLEIKNVLDYLINELKVSPQNIEKCPSVLYFSIDINERHKTDTAVTNIKNNVKFLQDKKYNIKRLDSCLHVLAVNSEEVAKTYDYVTKKYGLAVINKIPSLLGISVFRFNEIEDISAALPKSLTPNEIFSMALTTKRKKDLYNIAVVCQKYGITVIGAPCNTTADNIEDIITLCKDKKIPFQKRLLESNKENLEKILKICEKPETKTKFYLSMARREAQEVEDIILLCKKKKINVNIYIFERTYDEINEIIYLCEEVYKIKVVNKMFHREPVEVNEYIKICIDNNITIDNTVFGCILNEFKKIVDYCIKNNIEIKTSFFRSDYQNFKDILKLCKDKKIAPTGTMFQYEAKLLEDIIKKCQSRGVKPSGTAIQRKPKEIDNMLKLCDDERVLFTKSVFQCTSKKLEKIIKICKDNGIYEIVNVKGQEMYKIPAEIYKNKVSKLEEIIKELKGYDLNIIELAYKNPIDKLKGIVKICEDKKIAFKKLFLQVTNEEFEEIITLCQENKLKIRSIYFNSQKIPLLKTAIDLCKKYSLNSRLLIYSMSLNLVIDKISFIRDNYGEDYILNFIILRNKDYIKNIFDFFKEKNILSAVKENGITIIHYSLQSIKDKYNQLVSLGLPLLNSKGGFSKAWIVPDKKLLDIVDKHNTAKKHI